MVRQLILALSALTLAACNGERPPPAPGGPRAAIAPEVIVTLPVLPGYPETRTYAQVLRARYGWRSATLETILSLTPETVEAVLAVPGGPRVATVRWSESGVSVDRTVFTPPDLAPENMMADLFIAYWPADMVREALPRGVVMDVSEDGARVVRRGDEVILSITPDAEAPNRLAISNALLNYELTIESQALE
jgi:hypothetical protein